MRHFGTGDSRVVSKKLMNIMSLGNPDMVGEEREKKGLTINSKTKCMVLQNRNETRWELQLGEIIIRLL